MEQRGGAWLRIDFTLLRATFFDGTAITLFLRAFTSGAGRFPSVEEVDCRNIDDPGSHDIASDRFFVVARGLGLLRLFDLMFCVDGGQYPDFRLDGAAPVLTSDLD